MSRPLPEERREQLRRSVDERQRQLNAAVSNLEEVAIERLSLGGRVSQDPWAWLAGACIVGLVLGLRNPGYRAQ